MLKFVLAGATAGLLAASVSAQTADLNSWAGPYAGIQGGYGFDGGRPIDNVGNTSNNLTAIGNGTRPGQIDQDRSGAFGGGQLGYNWQRGKLIFGAEGDFAYMGQKGKTAYYSPTDGRGTYVKSDLDWLGSARGRLGYALGKGMIYATGGYAFGKVKGSAEFDAAGNTTVNYFGDHKYTAQGWTAGAGMEFHPFTQGMMSRVSLGLETTYYDLGRSHIYALQTSTQPGYYTLGVKTSGYNTAFKINYAF